MELITKFKNYLLSQKDKPSDVTVKNYLADIKQFISWVEITSHTPFQPQSVSIQIINEFKNLRMQTLSASSIDRHISSLRKFFTFLKLNGDIANSPFDQATHAQDLAKLDPWHIRDFKNYLYIYNASHLTIKNYLIDVKQFLSWAETALRLEDNWNDSEKKILIYLNNDLVNEYKTRLIKDGSFSSASINRKLSSLRKYLGWAAEQGYMDHNAGNSTVSNVSKMNQFEANQTISSTELASEKHRESKNPINPTQSQPTYSKIPPIRLFQKMANAGTLGFDLLITSPIAFTFRKAEHGRWIMKGKPLFKPSHQFSFSRLNEHTTKLQQKIARISFKPMVKNISKDIYAPHLISTKHFPWYKKVIFHVRYTRPTWYHRYHQVAVAHYFNWAVLIIFSAAIGFGMYNTFVQKPNKSLAALPTAGKRILSFQGRLTDASDNPITSPTWIRFIVYNDASSSSSARLWEEADKVTPDQDGIFSLNLGSDNAGGEAPLCNSGNPPTSPATGACGIPQSLFAQNSALWLGVTVESKAELTPREQIATVAYAVNSETLQGLPPITQSGAGINNVVLALNSSGNLSIGGSTTFQATSGNFTLSGNALILNTNAGTNGNIALSPDGSGVIDLQKPVQNSTLNNNIPSAAGAFEIDDLLAVLATSSGQSAFTIDQNGLGPIISASHSGTAEFTLDNSGNGFFNGNITGQTLFTGGGSTYYINNTTSNLNSLTLANNLTVSGNVASDLIPSINDTYSLGSDPNAGGKEWLNLYAKNIYSNGVLVGASFFQRNAGVLSPTNITDDLAIGGTATSTAKFQVVGLTGNATTSGNLTFTNNPTIQTTSQQNLLLGSATTGSVQLAPNGTTGLFVANTGKVGIGVTNPLNTLQVGNLGSTGYINNNIAVGDGSNAIAIQAGTTGYLTASGNLVLGANTNTTNQLFLSSTGSIGIGTNSPLTSTGLDIEKNALGNSALVVNQQGLGDIIAASASGATQFKVSNAGNVYGRTFTDLDNTSYFLDPAGVTNSLLVAGTVGIGTTNPLLSSGLDIEKNALGNAAQVVNQQGLGDIFTASTSGTPKFTIANDGTIKNDLIPNINNTYSLGSDPTAGGKQWLNIYGQNIYANGQLLTSVWQRNLGVLSPLNITDDLAIGGTATSTAKFQVIGLTGNATTSGNLTFTSNPTIQTTSMQNLLLGSATTGSVQLAPNGTTGLFVANTGNVGVGTTNPSGILHLSSNSTGGTQFKIQNTDTGGHIFRLISTGTLNTPGAGSFVISDETANTTRFLVSPIGMIGIGATTATSLGNAQLVVNQTNTSGLGDIIAASASGTTKFVITNDGTVGIASNVNDNTVLSKAGIDVRKDSFGNALALFQQLSSDTNADIITASGSANTTQFRLTNTGNVIGRTFTDLDNSSYFLDPAGVTNSLIIAGTEGVGTTTPLSKSGLDIEKDSFGNSTFVVNQSNNVGPILTASSSGTTRFTVANDGTLIATKYTTDKGLLYLNGTTGTIAETAQGSSNTVLHGNGTSVPTFSAVDLTADVTGTLPINKGGTNGTATPTSGQVAYGTGTAYAFTTGSSTGLCLQGNGASAPTWGSCGTSSGGGSTNYWTLNQGAISTYFPSVDILAGTTTGATTSAKFAVTGLADSFTPAASVSATVASGGTGTGIVLSGDGSIQSLVNGALTIGGGTTGNITLSPLNGAGNVSINAPALNTTNTTFALLNTTATTINFAGAASTLNIGAAAGTTTFKAATLDDNQATVALFGTPTTLNVGGTSQTDNFLGSVSLGTNTSQAITVNGLIQGAGVNNALQPVGNGTTDLGSALHYWGTVYASNFISPVSGGTSGFWQLSNNVLSPVNFWNDLAVGGSATSSATPFQVFATSYKTDAGTGNQRTVPAGTATTSGNLTFTGTSSQINLLNGTALTIQGSGGGDSSLSTLASLNNNGALTLANNLAVNGGSITSSASIGNIFTTSVTTLNIAGSATAINLKGDVTLGTNGSNLVTFNGTVHSSIFPSTLGGPYDLGALGNRWGNIYATNVYLPVAGGTDGYWTLGNSVLSPTNNWNDLAVGGTATSSATAFQVFANAFSTNGAINSGTIPAGTATTSGNITFRGTPASQTVFQQNILNGANLGFYTSVGGDAGLNTNPALYLANTNRVGILTNSPTAALDVAGAASISSTLTFRLGGGTIQTTNNQVLNLGGNTTGSIAFGSNISSSIIPILADSYNLGSISNEWDTLYVRQIVTPSTGGIGGFWQLSTSGVLSPANITNDLAIGGIATGSATPFQVFAQAYTNDLGTIPAGSATTSGNLTFRGVAGSQTAFRANILNGGSLGFYTSAGGDKGETIANPALFIAGNGSIGIGTNTPLNLTGLDIEKNSLGNAAFNVNQLGLGDVLTASVSGTTKFVLNNNGNLALGPGVINAQGILDVASAGQLFPSDLTLGQVAATNWVANPSLEFATNPTSGWTPTTGSLAQYSASNVATESAVFGGHALKFFTMNSGAYSDNSACIPILPSTTYNLSAYIYRVSGYSGNTTIDWQEYSGVSCTTNTVDGANVGTTTTNTWTRVNESFTTGASTKSIQVRAVDDGSSVGTAYFDGFQLERGSTTTPYLDGSLGPGYSWDNTGAPNATDSSRLAGSTFAYQTLNAAGGIGAASRTQFPTLQVDQNGSGDIIAASASGATQFQVTNAGNILGRKFTDLDNSIYYLDPAGLTVSASVAGSMTFTPAAEHDINFLNNSNLNFQSSPGGDAGLASRLFIQGNSGNVGIGTITPSDTLDIAGNATASGNLSFRGTNVTHNFNILNGGNLSFNTSVGGTAALNPALYLKGVNTATASALVAINNTNPTRNLDVVGSWGGNEIDDAETACGGSTNVGGTGIFFSMNYTMTGCASPHTWTFNITDEPQVNGTFFMVRIRAASANSQLATSALQINGSSDGSVTQTSGNTPINKLGLYVYNGGWSLIAANDAATNNNNIDLAELIPFGKDRPTPGELLTTDVTSKTVQLVKSNKEYDQKTVGIVTTNPNTTFGYPDNNSTNPNTFPIDGKTAIALAGRVPTVVTSLDGPIEQGDGIVTSPLSGAGMKPLKASQTVGKALEPFDPSQTSCTTVSSYDAINWPADDGTNSAHPCFGVPVSGFDATTQSILTNEYHLSQTDIVYVGKVMVLVGNGYVDPDVNLTTTGDMHISDPTPSTAFTVPHYYTLSDAVGHPLTKMGGFLELVAANLRAGSIQTQQLLTNTLSVTTDNVTIAGQSLHDYVASIVSEVLSQTNQSGNGTIAQSDSVKTNIISPLDNSNIAIRIKNSGIEIAKDASSSAVASIDNNGNATFSGTLNSQSLAINGDATVSGTLHANNIEANTISGLSAVVGTLSAQNITNVTNIYMATPSAAPNGGNGTTGSDNSSSSSGQLLAGNDFTDIASFSAYFAYVPNLKATTGIFTDGLTSLGGTSLADTTIDGQLSIGSQLILADTSVNVLGADFAIQPLRQGGVNFEGGLVAIDTSGNLTINGNTMVKGNLAVGTLSPLAGQDFSISLNNGAASGSANTNFTVKNASNSAVFAINQLGDVVASGTANINKLNFNLVQPALALSDTEVQATGSAGTAAIKAHQKELTIDNVNVTNQSLIYITPVGTNQTPYLERQVSGTSFTVGIPSAQTEDVNFNWLIVN